ncbi:DUF6297 family protein [Propionibacteriaceae bacterium Y1685]
MSLADVVRPDAPSSPTDERDLTAQMKEWRQGRATRTLGQALSNAYVAIFGVLVIGAMVVNVIFQAQVTVSACDTTTCLAARTALPWAASAFAIATALAAANLFGPVVASAAEGFWLMDAPVRRGRLLGGRLVGVVLATGVVGLLLGALVAALSGQSPTAIVAWSVATGLASAASVGFAATQQSRDHTIVTRVFSGLFQVITLVAFLFVIAVAAAWIALPDLGDQLIMVPVVLGGVALIGVVVWTILARRRLDGLRRARLISGGSLVSGLAGSMYALDLGLMRDILTERRCEEIGNVKPRSSVGVGLTALTWRDVLRLRRFPKPLFAVVATIVVPYALDALGLAVIAPPVAALALFGATVPLLGQLRVLTRTGGLARTLPFNPGQIKRAAVVVPAVIALLWALACFPAYLGFGEGAVVRTIPEAIVISELTAAAGLFGAIRWTIAKPINYSAPMVSTQAGAMPPGMFTNMIRGFDMCLLITAPILFGLPVLISVVLAILVGSILLSSINAAEMQERAKQQQADLEKARKANGR